MKIIPLHRNKDSELVKSCLENNRIAQKKLFDNYKDAMYTTAYRMTGNEADASDVLQEAFIEVFQNLNDFRHESSLGSWIKIIVVRKALRKLKLYKNYESILEAENVENMDWDQDFTAEYLDKAIRSLPESARTIFLLIEVEGLKHQEVAEMLNINEGTSKSQLHYSKVLLRKKLKHLIQ